jgi:hypothetical protein
MPTAITNDIKIIVETAYQNPRAANPSLNHMFALQNYHLKTK